MHTLREYIEDDALLQLIGIARTEDLGPQQRDVTSALFIDPTLEAEANVVLRKPGTVAGLALLEHVAAAYDPALAVTLHHADGEALTAGTKLATVRGRLVSILAAERVMLNFLGHLSGVATHTAAYVAEVVGTAARIYDTRKTLPGLRGLQKYAVACGGGATHRRGLYDAVLVKDNHLAHVPPADLTGAIARMIRQARESYPDLRFVMVEVDTLTQLEKVLPAAPDLVLLDNMLPATLREAVALRGRAAESNGFRVELEASGGITLAAVRAAALSGVDRISVGALTHSSVNLDVGLDLP